MAEVSKKCLYNVLNRIPNLWKIKSIIVLAIVALLVLSLGGTAFAYNRYNAVNYADQW